MWRIGQIQVALPTLIRERFLQACDIAVLTWRSRTVRQPTDGRSGAALIHEMRDESTARC